MVPLAIPLIAGPGVLAAVMIYGHQVMHPIISITAILLAWILSLIILLSSPYLQEKLGDRGVVAIERLMGLILILMATEMFFAGIKTFLAS